ncbi:hypothetical protein JYT22_00660 [Endomicrobium sp. AH-315-J14]|nr:hypothetical protein [Endomicrobium sp. AH-315-J14]
MGEIIVQIDIVQLLGNTTTSVTEVITDPQAEFNDATPKRPTVAEITAGPHRYTIMAPHDDESIVNIGHGTPEEKRLKDHGITGRTKSHIHWHTTEPPQTMLALGGVTKEGFNGYPDTNNLENNEGIMGVTDGFCWFESEKDQYILSRAGHATLRTHGDSRRIVVQADKGYVDVIAKKGLYNLANYVKIQAISDIAPVETINYKGDWCTAEVPAHAASKWMAYVAVSAAALTYAIDVGSKGKKMYDKVAAPGFSGLKKDISGSAKWLLGLGKFAWLLYELATMAQDEPAGCVKIAADSKVAIFANYKVSIFGGIAFSANSLLYSSISSAAYTAVVSGAFAGVTSAFSYVYGWKWIHIESSHGEVQVHAKTEVGIHAHGKAELVGHDGVQVSSHADAFMLGDKSVSVCGGLKTGGALKATEKGVNLGTFTGSDKARSPVTNEYLAIVHKRHMNLHWHDSEIKLDKEKITVKSKELILTADSHNITMEGDKILLN